MTRSCLNVLALSFFASVFAAPALPESPGFAREASVDPRVEAYIERNRRCPDASDSYGWICGAIVRMPGNHITQACTSLDEPFFSGSLSIPSKSDFLGQILILQYKIPLELLLPCTDDPSWNNPSTCATVSVFPLQEPVFGVFRDSPPEQLPDDLPDPTFSNGGHTLEPDAFSNLDGAPVTFFYTRWIGKKPGEPQDQCKLTTLIAGADIGISLTLPCVQMTDWRTHLRMAISHVKKRIVREDKTASFDALPDAGVILISPWQSETIDDLSHWLDLNR